MPTDGPATISLRIDAEIPSPWLDTGLPVRQAPLGLDVGLRPARDPVDHSD